MTPSSNTSAFNTIEGIAELVAAGETVHLTVKGRSMSPTFRHNKDIIAISPVGDNVLSVGDVVLFDRGDCLCVHRIIERDGDHLVIRGDGNSIKALEYADVSSVKGIILSGTFRNGKPFSVYDDEWKDNTEFVMENARLLSFWHRITGIVRRYPLSLAVSAVLLYLSFFNPGTMHIPFGEGGDKIIHALMYLFCSLVFWFEWLRCHRFNRRNILVGILPCVIFPIFMGALIEVAQETLTTCRSGDPYDLLADVAGVFAATVLSFCITCPVIEKIRKRRRKAGRHNQTA